MFQLFRIASLMAGLVCLAAGVATDSVGLAFAGFIGLCAFVATRRSDGVR